MKVIVSREHIPNFITLLRIVGTACLLFMEPFSIAFYVVYTLSGLSDAVDGWLARRMKVTSEYGAKLDSIADLMFYAVMLLKIFPVLWKKLPIGIWVAVGGILCLRICSYAVAAWKYGCFASLHTYMNKLTGLVVFVMPYIISLSIFVPFCAVACVIAGIASGQELLIHLFKTN